MNATVWISSWQMECCGEPFSEGSRVMWAVKEPDTEWLAPVIGGEHAATVTHAEEHHSDAPVLSSVEGVVQAIRAVHYMMAPKPDGKPQYLYPVEGSGKILPVVHANGWDKIEGMEFGGYLVDLREVREQTSPGS